MGKFISYFNCKFNYKTLSKLKHDFKNYSFVLSLKLIFISIKKKNNLTMTKSKDIVIHTELIHSINLMIPQVSKPIQPFENSRCK